MADLLGLRREFIANVKLGSPPSNSYRFSEIQLSFSALAKLTDNQECNNCDLLLVLFAGNDNKEIGRTKVSVGSSNLEVSWPDKFLVKYHFWTALPFIIQVYQLDQESSKLPVQECQLNDRTLLAECYHKLSEIVTADSRSYTFFPTKKLARLQIASLTVQAEETVASRVLTLNLNYSPTDSQKKNGMEVQFFEIYKIENGDQVLIYTTKPFISNLIPKRSVPFTRQELSKAHNLVIKGFNFSRKEKHTMFGKLETSVSGLKTGKKKEPKNLYVNLTERHTFLEYHHRYYNLNLMVAVELFATNAPPKTFTCGPHIDSLSISDLYAKVIQCAYEAIKPYNSEQSFYFPAYGFGGRIFIDGKTFPFFSLTQDSNNSEVDGVKGYKEAYKGFLSNVTVDNTNEPASLVELIKKAKEYVSGSSRKYHVLLIITDGVLSNVQDTIDAVVGASSLPLSVIIVGLKDGNYKRIEKLRTDTGHPVKSSTGDIALRDIVRCVPVSELPTDDKPEMAATLLKEIPEQFMEYIQLKIKPSTDMTPLSTTS